jgi:hypothetical protein
MKMQRQVQIRKNSKGKVELNLEAIDMREVLSECGIEYAETGKNISNGWIGTTCPFPGCGDESNHMGICLTSPVCTCFKCGGKGNYLTYLGIKLGNFGQAIDILEKNTPRELRLYRKEENEYNIVKVNLPEGATKIPSRIHTDYLKMRGFDPEALILMYDLHFCEYGEWADRIIVPIYQRNRLITFTSVDASEESDLRYKHLAKELSFIHCKNYLYGLEQCTGRNVIVVEGYFDKLRIGPGCVCTFGTKVTALQKKLLSKFSKSIILFDGDEAGWKNGEQLANDMSSHQEVELITLEEGMDPDKLPKEDIKELKRMLRTRW